MDFSDLKSIANTLRSQLEGAQDAAAKAKVKGESGGGMVRVVMNGRHEVIEVGIDKNVITSDDPQLLEDLVRAAVNDAVANVAEALKDQLTGLMNSSGIDLSAIGLIRSQGGGDER